MPTLSRRFLALGLAVVALGWCQPLVAVDKTAAELLPGSVVAYAEIPHPGKILDTVLDHPLAAEI
ncbi:MAG TPA: hypothetical protein VFV87_00035, partial [Pirellulaceae bacterium]|nr:hypothetical protein [Pirellulaceae bacterium]